MGSCRQTQREKRMTIKISFSDTTVRVAVEINGAIESAITELPQREWVGLDWNDLPEIYVGDTAFLHGARWAEAKLKEKNSV